MVGHGGGIARRAAQQCMGQEHSAPGVHGCLPACRSCEARRHCCCHNDDNAERGVEVRSRLGWSSCCTASREPESVGFEPLSVLSDSRASHEKCSKIHREPYDYGYDSELDKNQQESDLLENAINGSPKEKSMEESEMSDVANPKSQMATDENEPADARIEVPVVEKEASNAASTRSPRISIATDLEKANNETISVLPPVSTCSETSTLFSSLLEGYTEKMTSLEAEAAGVHNERFLLEKLAEVKLDTSSPNYCECSLPDGMYRGEVHSGTEVYHGYGCLMMPTYISIGTWVDGNFSGHGEQVFVDGRSYDGQFHNNAFSGHGRMRWQTPRGEMVYEGEYVSDRKHGHGKFIWPSGKSYDGQWVAGKRHGEGIDISTRGHRSRSVWKDNVLVESTPLPLENNHLVVNVPPSQKECDQGQSSKERRDRAFIQGV